MKARVWASRRWIVLGVAVVAFAGLFGSYLSGKPGQLADRYREASGPAAHEINRAMSAVYASFDDYLSDSRLPPGKLKGVHDFNAIKRRLLPLYRSTERALARSVKRIERAEAVIAERAGELVEIPSAALVSAPAETGEAAEQADDYLRRIRRFLASFSKYAAYARRVNALDRRALMATSRSGLDRAESPRDARASVRKLRREFGSQRRTLERLKPHRDAERLHETARDFNDAYVDYLDGLERFLEQGDLLAAVRAELQLLRANRRLGTKLGRQRERFERESGLQQATRALTERANEFEEAVAALGSGTDAAERTKPWKRPPLPRPRHGQKQPGGDGEQRPI